VEKQAPGLIADIERVQALTPEIERGLAAVIQGYLRAQP
jgi:hypothetical protein